MAVNRLTDQQVPAPDPADSQAALAALLRRAASGDEAAWSELVAAYLPRVFAMARSRVKSHDVAEEVAQSVFVTVASKLPAGGYTEQGRFEPWLFRVTMNRIRDEVRRQKRHADPTDPIVFGDRPSTPADAHPDGPVSEVIRLRSALAELGEDDRQVIELRHQGGLSFKQIADVLDEPLGTVLARHHRALKKVRQLMEDDAGSSTGDRGDQPASGGEA